VFTLIFEGVQVLVRGKAHNEWKVMVSGERRTVKDDQYFIDDRATIWGKGTSSRVLLIFSKNSAYPSPSSKLYDDVF
jgi:hypothetical protein